MLDGGWASSQPILSTHPSPPVSLEILKTVLLRGAGRMGVCFIYMLLMAGRLAKICRVVGWHQGPCVVWQAGRHMSLGAAGIICGSLSR